MIEVPFNIERHDSEGHNPLSMWIQRKWNMPWLNYLLENNQGIETEKWYDPSTDQYTVKFKFKMDPKKETFYRIKYGDGDYTNET
jgi:hypothetical protein